MALLDDVGPLAANWQQTIGAFSDPELRGTLGSFQQYAWASFQAPYLAQGVQPPTISFGQMQRFISAASAVATSSVELGKLIDRVSRTGLDQSLTDRHMAPDIDARSLGDMPLGPNYRVRFEVDVTKGGFPLTEWWTWEAGGHLPATVNGLLDALNAAGDEFGTQYNMSFDGLTGKVYITTW